MHTVQSESGWGLYAHFTKQVTTPLSRPLSYIKSSCKCNVLFVFKVIYDFEKVSDRRGKCLCTCVFLSMCLSLASDSSETINVIIKLGTVIASDTTMHHMLIILTLTFKITQILIVKINVQIFEKLSKQCPSGLP